MRRSFLLTTLLALGLLSSVAVAQSQPSNVRKALPPQSKASPQTAPKKSTPKATPRKTTPRRTTTPAKSNAAAPTQNAPRPAVTPTSGPKVTYTAVAVDGPYIALTFDDGPHKVHTPRLLDILKARQVPATFFVLGKLVVTYPDIAKRIVNEGHEIADHTWEHPNLAKMSDAQVRNQLDRTRAAITRVTGAQSKIFRPPYGAFTERQRQWADREYGYKTILWDVDPLDWRKPGVSVVAQRIIDRTRAGSIILAHDIHGDTISAMPQVIDTLKARGYRFVTVSQLLAMEKKATPQAAPAATPAPVATPAPIEAAPAPIPAAATP